MNRSKTRRGRRLGCGYGLLFDKWAGDLLRGEEDLSMLIPSDNAVPVLASALDRAFKLGRKSVVTGSRINMVLRTISLDSLDSLDRLDDGGGNIFNGSSPRSNPNDIRTVKCASCGKLRDSDTTRGYRSAHWFVIALKPFFDCRPLDLASRQPDDLPVCGQLCAQKEFEKWMTDMRNRVR